MHSTVQHSSAQFSSAHKVYVCIARRNLSAFNSIHFLSYNRFGVGLPMWCVQCFKHRTEAKYVYFMYLCISCDHQVWKINFKSVFLSFRLVIPSKNLCNLPLLRYLKFQWNEGLHTNWVLSELKWELNYILCMCVCVYMSFCVYSMPLPVRLLPDATDRAIV